MNSLMSKLVPLSKTIIPVIKTLPANRWTPNKITKIRVLYSHGECKRNQSTETRNLGAIGRISHSRRLALRNLSVDGGRKSEWLENLKIPGLVHIQNIIKTQPNFKWGTLWNSDDKVLEWPVFDRSKQYENPSYIRIQSLVKSRLNGNLSQILSEKELKEIEDQRYMRQRVKNLGPDLAAVHFFYDRRAAVRLTGHNEWIVGGAPKFTSDEQLNHCIRGGFLDEERYTSRCRVEAVDCSNFSNNGIRYEGLKYLSGLRFLKWLSLKNQKYINVWCLDRIAGLTGTTLEYLDISKCDLDLGCIIALSRMQSLQMLVIKHPGDNIKVNNALTTLEELNPTLTVKAIRTGQVFGVPGVNDVRPKICEETN